MFWVQYFCGALVSRSEFIKSQSPTHTGLIRAHSSTDNLQTICRPNRGLHTTELHTSLCPLNQVIPSHSTSKGKVPEIQRHCSSHLLLNPFQTFSLVGNAESSVNNSSLLVCCQAMKVKSVDVSLSHQQINHRFQLKVTKREHFQEIYNNKEMACESRQ